MKIVHLCENSAATLYTTGWYYTYKYCYDYIVLQFEGKHPSAIIANRYHLIDVARRDYTKPERVKIRW